MKYSVLITILIFITLSCKKDESNIIHRDVFKCEINGIHWEAKCLESPPFGCKIVDCQYYEMGGGFEIAASNEVLNNGGMSFYKSSGSGGLLEGDNILTIGTYGDKINNIQYNIDKDKPGTIVLLTLDKENKIIECNFSFKAFSLQGDSVEISNGYFKVKYRP